ncbi:MAG: glycosyltransferase family 4 protein [Vicinamibacterales bacterium]
MIEGRPEDARIVDSGAIGERVDARVVLLTNFVPPYRLPVFEALNDRVSSLTVLVSTPMEGNRSWKPAFGHLDVRVQKTITLSRRSRHPAGFSDLSYLHVPWGLIRQLHSLRPDVVISGELGTRTLLSALYCFLAKRPPLIVWATLSERTEQGRGCVRRTIRRWILRRADRVIVNGASGERYVLGYGVPANRIDHIPYVSRSEHGEADARPRALGPVRNLLFVGQLTERKGLAQYLSALDAWARSHPFEDITLTVVGSGPQREAIEHFRPGGRLVIEVLGDRHPGALSAFYARADALVFPTLADEWGLVVNEALAAGVPVIGSIHSQAIEELCEEGKTGWRFDPESRTSTLSAIEKALTTTANDLAAMRKSARARVARLTPEWAAGRLVASMRTALAERDSSVVGGSVP